MGKRERGTYNAYLVLSELFAHNTRASARFFVWKSAYLQALIRLFMVENEFCKYQEAQIFLRQTSCLATRRTAHKTESKSHGGKCVNCLHVLFKFGPKSRFFIRHDVLKSEATVHGTAHK